MNRRSFFGALAALVVAPKVPLAPAATISVMSVWPVQCGVITTGNYVPPSVITASQWNTEVRENLAHLGMRRR